MLILARKVLWFCLFVFLPHSAMAAMDGPNAYLKGINIICYSLTVERTVGGNDCNIDREKLDTSLQFVANQSTTLKIVPYEQRMHRSSELYANSDKSSLSSVEKEAAKKVAHDYLLSQRSLSTLCPYKLKSAVPVRSAADLTHTSRSNHI